MAYFNNDPQDVLEEDYQPVFQQPVEDDYLDDEDGEYYEVVCPKCGDEICVSEDVLLDGGVECPSCGENLEFDYSSLTAENINGEGSEEE